MLRNGIIATTTPRVAGKNSFGSKPTTFEKSMFLEGFDTIV
jgi:hypothetical protein